MSFVLEGNVLTAIASCQYRRLAIPVLRFRLL